MSVVNAESGVIRFSDMFLDCLDSSAIHNVSKTLSNKNYEMFYKIMIYEILSYLMARQNFELSKKNHWLFCHMESWRMFSLLITHIQSIKKTSKL